MKIVRVILSASVLAATLAACANQLPDPAEPRSLSPSAISNDQLQRFASAAKKVNAIYQEYAPRLQGSQPGPDNLLAREANGREAHAVWDSGLTVPEFNAINAAIQQDPGLMQRYTAVYYQA